MVIAGPNGSGKTTFVTEYLRESEISEYISNEIFFEIFMRDIRNGGA